MTSRFITSRFRLVARHAPAEGNAGARREIMAELTHAGMTLCTHRQQMHQTVLSEARRAGLPRPPTPGVASRPRPACLRPEASPPRLPALWGLCSDRETLFLAERGEQGKGPSLLIRRIASAAARAAFCVAYRWSAQSIRGDGGGYGSHCGDADEPDQPTARRPVAGQEPVRPSRVIAHTYSCCPSSAA